LFYFNQSFYSVSFQPADLKHSAHLGEINLAVEATSIQLQFAPSPISPP
jgi:hypothetical protein